MGNYEPDRPKGGTLLFQTGYLTISGIRDFGGTRFYSLDFPNREIRESFLRDISFSAAKRTIVEELIEELPAAQTV